MDYGQFRCREPANHYLLGPGRDQLRVIVGYLRGNGRGSEHWLDGLALRNRTKLAGARHGRSLKPGDEQRAEDVRRGGPEFAFGEIRDEDLGCIHDVAQVNASPGLAKDIS